MLLIFAFVAFLFSVPTMVGEPVFRVADDPAEALCLPRPTDKVEYQGSISHRGENVPITTLFETFNISAATQGRYVFVDRQKKQCGTLTNCLLVDRVMTCKWTDAFGSGNAQFTFDASFDTFIGRWNRQYPWTGRRTK